MEIYRQLFVTVCLVVSLACYSVKAQGCPVRAEACVTLTAESFEPLLMNLLESAIGDQTPVVIVNITNFRVVCETSGIIRGEARQTSIVTSFSCTSTLAAACPSDSESGVQYAARCALSSGSFVWDFGSQQSDNPAPSLFSAPVSYCGGCRFDLGGGIDTLCVGQCNTEGMCTEGLQRCTGFGLNRCCNFYYDDNGDRSDDVCCSECPVGFVPDENFDCGCPNLAALTNGAVTYSDGNSRSAHYVFTVATFTCNPGYTIMNNITRTCQPNTGWDGDNNTACVEVMCPLLSDPDNGEVTVNARTVGENVMYSCDDNFYLSREETRTCQNSGQWSEEEPTCDACEVKIPDCVECSGTGYNPVCDVCKEDFTLDLETNECKQNDAETGKSSCGAGCIAGIIVALVALLIAGITALVIFGIYKYLTNPATKLAKADTEGLNRVARDNPLYLDPATVVEVGPEAAAPLATPPEACYTGPEPRTCGPKTVIRWTNRQALIGPPIQPVKHMQPLLEPPALYRYLYNEF